jgi:hypothetical protein
MKFTFSLVSMTAAASLLHQGLPAADAAAATSAVASGPAEAKIVAPSLLRGSAASSGSGGSLRGPSAELAGGSAAGAGDAGRNLAVQDQLCWSATSGEAVQVPCYSLSGCYDGVDYLAATQTDATNEGTSYCGSHLFTTYSTGVHPNDDEGPWHAQCCSSSD